MPNSFAQMASGEGGSPGRVALVIPSSRFLGACTGTASPKCSAAAPSSWRRPFEARRNISTISGKTGKSMQRS